MQKKKRKKSKKKKTRRRSKRTKRSTTNLLADSMAKRGKTSSSAGRVRTRVLPSDNPERFDPKRSRVNAIRDAQDAFGGDEDECELDRMREGETARMPRNFRVCVCVIHRRLTLALFGGTHFLSVHTQFTNNAMQSCLKMTDGGTNKVSLFVRDRGPLDPDHKRFAPVANNESTSLACLTDDSPA